MLSYGIEYTQKVLNTWVLPYLPAQARNMVEATWKRVPDMWKRVLSTGLLQFTPLKWITRIYFWVFLPYTITVSVLEWIPRLFFFFTLPYRILVHLLMPNYNANSSSKAKKQFWHAKKK